MSASEIERIFNSQDEEIHDYDTAMKRSQHLALLLIFSLALSTPALAASPKKGSACKKEKLTSISQGKKFTCIKKGKKLVWNKGVKVSSKKAKASKKPTAAPATTARPTPTPTATATPTPTSTSKAAAAGYTLEQVRANNNASSCWSAIDGSVYDLTKWIGSHPGGAANIRGLCGIDGTSAFKSRHGNSSGPTGQLANYLLGPLR
jgi:cytochrome b involved in lipid metabolism